MKQELQKNIIKEFGLEELTEKSQAEILTKMTESIIKRIVVNVLEKLSDEDSVEFEKLQEKAKPEEIEEFLKSKIDNYEQLVQETISGFKEEMKESINNLKKSLE